MAQDCMAIFERDKLPTIAHVEQVCTDLLGFERLTPLVVLRNGADPRRQSTQEPCGRYGPVAR